MFTLRARAVDRFVDLFGYLVIVVHGLSLVAQSMASGSTLFLVSFRSLAPRLGAAGPPLLHDSARIAGWSALGLFLSEGTGIALQTTLLVSTVDLSVGNVLGARFALTGMVKMVCAALLFLALRRRGARAPTGHLLALVVAVLAAATLTTHAASRLGNEYVLLVLEWLHQLGAAIWVGGIPCFVMALARLRNGAEWRLVGQRFSRMSMAGVGCILVSSVAMSLLYVGSWQGFYGTSYGIMVGSKVALFLMLLGLGAGNLLLVERLGRDPTTVITPLKRFAEVEIGIGLSLFFAAASLTSAPPAIDFTGGEHGPSAVSWQMLAAHYTARWPSLASPSHDALALPALHHDLVKEAAQEGVSPDEVFIPGTGELPPRNRADVAWSEYNHHWAGICILTIGLLAVSNQVGVTLARHWPLLFLALAGFLFLRADPEIWPLGYEGFFPSLRDPEVLQHRLVVILLLVSGWCEWRMRAGAWRSPKAAMTFPLLSLLGGILLLTHNHAAGSAREQLMIELTHVPIALLAVAAAGARWLELRLKPPADRTGGWAASACFVLIGCLLLLYREE